MKETKSGDDDQHVQAAAHEGLRGYEPDHQSRIRRSRDGAEAVLDHSARVPVLAFRAELDAPFDAHPQ